MYNPTHYKQCTDLEQGKTFFTQTQCLSNASLQNLFESTISWMVWLLYLILSMLLMSSNQIIKGLGNR